MPQVCILTDSTALPCGYDFPGRELVYILSNESENGLAHFRPNGVHSITGASEPPGFFLASVETFRKAIISLSNDYNEIIVLLCSGLLNPGLLDNAGKAAELLRGRVALQIIDSQSTAVGLGYLVEKAASAARNHMPSTEIVRLIKRLLQHIYTLICTRDLKNLAASGALDLEHALVGEMLGISPVLILENGQLIPTQKARNARHLVEIILEFLEEFYNLKQVQIFTGNPVFGGELNQLRERIGASFPEIPVQHFTASQPVMGLLGSRSLGLVVMDNDT